LILSFAFRKNEKLKGEAVFDNYFGEMAKTMM